MAAADERPPASLDSVVHLLLPPSLLLSALLLSLLLLSALCFSLPFVLSPADSFSRRSILLLSCLLTFQAGALLSSSFLLSLDQSLRLADSTDAPPSLPLLLFIVGLLSPPSFERLFLLLGGAYVRRRRAREAELEEEAALQGLSAQAEDVQQHHQQQQRTPSAASSTANGASQSGSSSSSSTPARAPASRGRRDPPNSLVPPPISEYRHPTPSEPRHSSDYRHKRPLDAPLSSDDDDFDFDDADQLSPPLFSSSTATVASALLSYPSSSASSSRSSYYSYAVPVLDAHSFITEQRYTSRCLFCKENIATRKAAAYHSAGCPLKHLPAFTVASHSLAALRGKRQLSLDDGRIPPHLLSLLALTEGLALHITLGAAVAATAALRNPLAPGTLRLCSGALALASLVVFLAFSVGLSVRQQRASTAINVAAGAVVSLALPCSGLLSAALLSPASSSAVSLWLLAWLGGVQCWVAVVDVVLEEMERKDAKEGKWIAFVVGFALTAGLAIT